MSPRNSPSSSNPGTASAAAGKTNSNSVFGAKSKPAREDYIGIALNLARDILLKLAFISLDLWIVVAAKISQLSKRAGNFGVFWQSHAAAVAVAVDSRKHKVRNRGVKWRRGRAAVVAHKIKVSGFPRLARLKCVRVGNPHAVLGR